jgi:hypothetical protein
MDPETFESEVLTKTREIMASAPWGPGGTGRSVVDVRLSGSYPLTEVVVAFTQDDELMEERWPVWGPPTQSDRMRVAPESIAALIWANISDP